MRCAVALRPCGACWRAHSRRTIEAHLSPAQSHNRAASHDDARRSLQSMHRARWRRECQERESEGGSAAWSSRQRQQRNDFSARVRFGPQRRDFPASSLLLLSVIVASLPPLINITLARSRSRWRDCVPYDSLATARVRSRCGGRERESESVRVGGSASARLTR